MLTVLSVRLHQLGKLKEGAASIPGEFLREGLTAVVSVKVPEPEFEGFLPISECSA